MTYSLQCRECPEDHQAVYIGETSSSGFIRGKEHWYQYQQHALGKKSGEHSALGRHVNNKHEGDHKVEFSMKIWSHHLNSTHVRQVTEAVRINTCKSENLINTRGEKDSDIVSEESGRVSRL